VTITKITNPAVISSDDNKNYYTVRKEQGVLRNSLLMAQKQNKQFLTVKKLILGKVFLKFPELKMGNPYH
jgi:hypothetical protein